jgi:hypothetical protein
MQEALAKAGVDTTPYKYLRKIKAFSSVVQASVTSPSSVRGLLQKVNANVDSFGLGSSLTKQVTALLSDSVKALLPASKELYVTRIVDSLMELKGDLGVDQYQYYDPKVQKKMRNSAVPRKSTPFKDAIVFMVGGGNYIEYQNLQDYAKVIFCLFF